MDPNEFAAATGLDGLCTREAESVYLDAYGYFFNISVYLIYAVLCFIRYFICLFVCFISCQLCVLVLIAQLITRPLKNKIMARPPLFVVVHDFAFYY